MTLAGGFDVSTAEDLRHCLARVGVLGAKQVRIDMKKVTFFDSSGIGLLVSACTRVRADGGTFSVSCGEGTPLRVLELLGLVDFFELSGEFSARSSQATTGAPKWLPRKVAFSGLSRSTNRKSRSWRRAPG
ncbi:MAG: STAS domain-containing protein [Acidimicrobiales bacterium]